MYPNGLFGLDALRVVISPIAIFGTVFFILYLRNYHVKAGRTALLLVVMGIFFPVGRKSIFAVRARLGGLRATLQRITWRIALSWSSIEHDYYRPAIKTMAFARPAPAAFPRCTSNHGVPLSCTHAIQLFYERLLHGA